MAGKAVKRDDDAFAMWGELREGLHLAGYSFERACRRLETLLEGDCFKAIGFSDVNAFMDSLNFAELRAAAEARKRIAKRIKELQPAVSNRQIAKTLGVGRRTVDRDTGPNGPPVQKLFNKRKAATDSPGPNGPPAVSGAKAAKIVARKLEGKEARLAKVQEDERRVLNLRPITGTFRTIVLDPAWDYDWLSVAARAKPGYAMQPIDQLRELDVMQWADKKQGCHLYCWTTNNFMAEACKLVEHWGFQHRVILTWIKPAPFGLGTYFRNSTEHVIFATLGDTTTRHAAASMPTHFEAPRGEHSEKPERFYEIVRAASYPPYGEGNQRTPRPDFINLFEEVAKEAAE